MTGAERQKRHRARRRKGVAVLPVEVGEETYWALRRANLITEADLTTSSAVAMALGEALKDWTGKIFCNALRVDVPKGATSHSS